MALQLRHLPLFLGSAVIIIAAVLTFALITARSSLRQGLAEVQHVQADLRGIQADNTPDPALGGTMQHMERAHADFQRAAAWLDPFTLLLERLAWVPKVGNDLAAAPAASDLAEQVSAGSLDLLHGVVPVAQAWRVGAHHPSMAELTDEVMRSRGHFRRACNVLDAARQTRRRLTGNTSPRIAVALHTFDRQLPRLLGLCQGLAIAPELLGHGHARTYLIAYQNPDELRATGGFIGSAGLMTVHNGNPTQRFSGTSFDQENFTVPSPEPVQLYNTEPYWLFRDSNWSPDFPTTAALERFFLKLDTHHDASGVIDITPTAAGDLLAATGPIFSPQYHRWITSANVANLADYYAHWSPTPGPLRLAPNTTGKQFILIVSRLILSRVGHMSLSGWLRLGAALSDAVTHRDLLVHFWNANEQSFVQSVRADGAINPTTADYLYVVDTNLSYNKINPYVHISESYGVRVRADRWLDARLTLTLTNAGEPPRYAHEGIGPGAGSLGGPEDYADFVRIYVPAGAQLVNQSGWNEPWSPGSAYGKTMFSGYVIVRHDRTRVIHLRYVVPPNVFSPSDGSRYSLYIQHQPGSRPDHMTISVTHDGHLSSWTIRRPTVDWTRNVLMRRVEFHPIPLPRSSPEVVVPGHWIEPHAYLSPPR
jgi:Protein of unknown function (DUF4012)